MDEQHFTDLFQKYMDQTSTPSEEAELMQVLDGPAFSGIRDRLIDEGFDHLPLRFELSNEQAEMIFNNVLGRETPVITMHTKRSILSIRRIAVAASVLVLLSVGSYFLFHAKGDSIQTAISKNDIAPGGNKAVLTLGSGRKIILDSATNGTIATQGNATITKLNNGQLAYKVNSNEAAEVLYNTMSTPRGGQYQLVLPDGTEVWLNAASSITFPTVFTGKERKVSITGEAYFEVTKDKTKPFHVQVNDMDVVVLGTHFNIDSYDDEAEIKTTLLEGSVKITRAHDDGAILKPGQQAVLSSGNNEKIKVANAADVDQVMAWKNGLFNFKNADLPTVMRQLERWYDVEVVYQGHIAPKKFGGKIGRDLNLSEVLEGLKETGIHFTINGKRLMVMP